MRILFENVPKCISFNKKFSTKTDIFLYETEFEQNFYKNQKNLLISIPYFLYTLSSYDLHTYIFILSNV